MCLGPLALLTACSAIPKDPDGTVDRLRSGAPVRAAFAGDSAEAAPARAIVERLAAKLGTRVAWREEEVEPSFHALERGELDLVVGHFAKQSPWMTQVDLSRAIGGPEPESGRTPALRIARPNGENRWIRLIDLEIGQ